MVLIITSLMPSLTLAHFALSFLKAFWKNYAWLRTRSASLLDTFELCFWMLKLVKCL